MLNDMFNIRILYVVDCYLLTVNRVTFGDLLQYLRYFKLNRRNIRRVIFPSSFNQIIEELLAYFQKLYELCVQVVHNKII